MSARLAHIVRHPVKSVGYEEIARARLCEGQALPLDRVWAIAHEAAQFAAEPADWAPKQNFVRGVAGPGLMAVRAEVIEAARIAFTHPDLPALEADLATAAGRAALVRWVAPLWPESRPGARNVVQVEGGALTDMRYPFVSLGNLASVEDLGARMGRALSIHRWRINLWVEGWAPWAEFGPAVRRIRVGEAVLEVAQRITRCRATCANPETGRVDVDTLAALQSHFSHANLGLYCAVVAGGEIGTGAEVEIL